MADNLNEPNEFVKNALAHLQKTTGKVVKVEDAPPPSVESLGKPEDGDEKTEEEKIAEAEKELAEQAKKEAAGEPKKQDEQQDEKEGEKEEPELPGFDVLAREKAALRKREQRAAELEKRFSGVAAAVEAGDVVRVMRELGFTHEQYNEQMLTGKHASPAAKRPAAGDSELAKEVAELKRMLVNQQVQSMQRETMQAAMSIAKDMEKQLPFVHAQGAHGKAIDYIEKYYADTGELPGETMEKSLRLALGAVERDLATEAKKWETVLTKVRGRGVVTEEEPVEAPEKVVRRPSEVANSPRKTLSNSSSGPSKPPAADEPKTDEDYRAKALALLTQMTK